MPQYLPPYKSTAIPPLPQISMESGVLPQPLGHNYIPGEAPGYDQALGLNYGDLGFMTLPVEKTVGGHRDNLWNPEADPWGGEGYGRGGWKDEYYDRTKTEGDPLFGAPLSPDFNPWTQGYQYSTGKKDGEGKTIWGWRPWLPDKIVYGQKAQQQPGNGQAMQWYNGQWVNVNGNNYAAGTSTAAPYAFKAEAPAVGPREETPAPFDGFHFGEIGKPGYQFMGGSFAPGATPGSSTFYQTQPASLNPTPDRTLGTLKPWNPAAAALQQYRSQP